MTLNVTYISSSILHACCKHPRVSSTPRLLRVQRGVHPQRQGVGRPLPKPPQSRRWAALYRICASAARGWAGSRFSWPGSAGRHPWRAEKPWLEARGSGGAQSGSCSAGRGAWKQRPRLTRVSSATKRAPASAVTPGPRGPHRTDLQCRAALAGNTTCAGATGRAPSAEPPACGARLARPGLAGTGARSRARSIVGRGRPRAQPSLRVRPRPPVL